MNSNFKLIRPIFIVIIFEMPLYVVEVPSLQKILCICCSVWVFLAELCVIKLLKSSSSDTLNSRSARYLLFLCVVTSESCN